MADAPQKDALVEAARKQRVVDSLLNQVDTLNDHTSALLDGRPLVKPTAQKVYSFLELYDADLPRPEGFLAEGVFCRQSLGMIAGRRGVGKTFLLLRLGAAVALGHAFGPYPTRTGRVMLMSEEMTEIEVRSRIRQMFPRDVAVELNDQIRIACKTGHKIDTPDALRRMAEFVGSQGGIDLLLCDALSDIKGTIPENDNDRVGEGARGLRDIIATELDCAVVVVHHMGRAREDGTSNPRGASALEDAAADIIHLGKSKTGSGYLGQFEKVRHASPPQPFGYSIIDTGTGVEIDIHEDHAGTSEAEEIKRVVAWLATKGEATLQETQDAMRWTKTVALGHLGQARTLGLVERFKLMGEHVWALPGKESQEKVAF